MLTSAAVDVSPLPFEASNYPRTYRVSRGYAVFLGLCGGLLALGGCVGCWYVASTPEFRGARAAFLTLLCLAFAFLGAYLIVLIVRMSVTLCADAIVLKECFTARTLLRKDIAGRRIIPTQYVSTLVLVPRARGAKKLKLARTWQTDPAFDAWFTGIPDLDTEELAKSQADLDIDPDLGFKSEARRVHVRNAKKIARFLNIAAWISLAWGFLVPNPNPLVILVLAALPLVAVGLWVRSKGIYQIEGRRNDARSSLAIVFLLPGLALTIRALQDFHMLRWKPVLSAAILLAIALTLVIAYADEKLRRSWPALLPFFFFGMFYAYGFLAHADALLDRSDPQTFEVAVVGKHISSGKSTSYYLHLDHWGEETGVTKASVPRSLYTSTAIGDTVCVHLHAGALGMPWYVVIKCD